MQCVGKLVVLTVASLTVTCKAHWRLTVPMTRGGPGYENDPLGSPVVCRHANPNPSIPRNSYAAGSAMNIRFEGGGHVGDCSVYLSYDVGQPTNSAQFVKIANLPDCRTRINTLVPIVLPSQLPSGDAILRWDQYALHQGSFIEWYVQCADVRITSSSTKTWESFNKFSIGSIYPGGMSNYRRNIAVPGDSDFYMTGPACVDDSINECALTAKGTRGYTGGGETVQMPTPTPTPTPPPIPTATQGTSPAPEECVPIGNCDAYSWCSQSQYVAWCSSQTPCTSPFCKTDGSVAAPTTTARTVPVTTAIPSLPPTGRRCVPTLESFYNDPAVYGPICEAQARGNVCTAPMCRWESSLVQERIQRHHFRGIALLQGGADVDSTVLSIDEGIEF